MKITALTRDNFEVCATAASKSYNKPLGTVDSEEYTRKIWNRHRNISEHFVKTIDILEAPRWLTLVMALQRHGVLSMTERSQRRCVPDKVSSEQYMQMMREDVPKQEARKVLPLDTLTDVTVTMNREAARNICAMLQKYQQHSAFRDAVEQHNIIGQLRIHYLLDESVEEPIFCPEFDMRAWDLKSDMTLPVYAFHQFARHRTIDLLSWTILSNKTDIRKVTNDTLVSCTFDMSDRAFDLFFKARQGADTQEPLREIARKMAQDKHDRRIHGRQD